MNTQLKILLVDDQPANLEILESFLVPVGQKTIKATNGLEALEKMESERPDLVLLDIMMPGMNGHEVCRRIRENHIYDDVPIVVVTALHGTAEMVKAIEDGADEFLTKPVSGIELQARVRSLLKKKLLKDQLRSAYAHINNLTDYMNRELTLFTSQTFSEKKAQRNLVLELLANETKGKTGPSHIIIGNSTDGKSCTGTLYSVRGGALEVTDVSFSLNNDNSCIGNFSAKKPVINNCDHQLCQEEECRHTFGNGVAEKIGTIRNFVHYNPSESDDLVLAFNYDMGATNNDADILKCFLLHSHVFSYLAEQMNEVDRAFRYLVSSLALAAEANDEDMGNHIKRVNRYSAVIADELKLPAGFINDIGFYAQMHDVGKIRTPPNVLKKTSALSDEEYDTVKDHTVLGAMILGGEPRLKMARDIAYSHHERYDGSGYPKGIKGEEIPLAARIVAMADVYDALRSKRIYKNELSHKKAVGIITTGNVRTMPYHFDPQVLAAFLKREKDFEEIFEELTDNN